jgi:hypothetical protein
VEKASGGGCDNALLRILLLHYCKSAHRVFACLAFTISSTAQAQPDSKSEPQSWHLNASLSEESIGLGLPVLALDQNDWPSHLPNPVTDGKAFRAIKAEVLATHPSGWRLGVVARSQAWLVASADAIAVAALEARSGTPAAPHQFQIAATSESWQGRGVTMGTPWWPIGAAGLWQWQSDVTLLKLQQLRTAEVNGSVSYLGAGAYDFDVASQRANTGITGRFLPASGDVGSGASFSFALQGRPLPDWQLSVRADDITSILKWSNLATDTSVLNSNNVSRAADGSLEYAPLLRGKKALLQTATHMGPRWQAIVGWGGLSRPEQASKLTFRVSRQSGINQHWLGWNSGDKPTNSPRWAIEFEPKWQAVKVEMNWGQFKMLMATDGRGIESQQRQLQLGWHTGF